MAVAQKDIIIPTVGVSPVYLYDATSDFTTEYIEFQYTSKEWSMSIDFDDTPSGAMITVLVCNDQNGTYKPYKTSVVDVDIDAEVNRVIFDSIMPFRFMKLDYTAGATTGNISIKIAK